MKIAVASMGTVPEAWVGVRFGACSQFLVFDLDTMEYVVVSVPPRRESPDRASLTAIRAVARHDVAAVITGDVKDVCRKTMLDLGIDVIDRVSGMTVREAVERYKATGLQAIDERQGQPTRIAITSLGEGLDAPLTVPSGTCTSFVLIDPTTKAGEKAQVEPGEPGSLHARTVRAIARKGATVVITPHVHPACCMAMHALAIEVYIAPEDITIGEAIELYEAGELEPAVPTL